MKLLFTGDFVINQSYPLKNINQDIIELFQKSDYNIVNLEAPVTESSSKIVKTGPHLKANKQSTLEALKALSINVCTLANNHILDYDEQGVNDTLSFCLKNKIKTVGAGKNLNKASETLFINSSEGKIALINFAENEWASSTEETAGANPMDVIDNTNQIQKAKKNADFVFVIIHGGHEYYNLPSPRMQKQYRFYAEQGADIIIGHHTHCVNGFEVHKGVPIYYSLGNFLFTKPNSNDDWYTGLVLEIETIKGVLKPKLRYIKQDKETFSLSFLNSSEKEKLSQRISNLNSIIKNPLKLNDHWNKYISSKYQTYTNYWSPLSFINNRYMKGAIRKAGGNFVTKKGIALYLNLMNCEAHSDLSKAVLKKYLNK